MAGPLFGVRVLDLTSVVMGPFATQILAELGAEVVKIETREGDNMRQPGPMNNPGMGYMFLNLNRGKRGLVLDLKAPAGRALMLRMARDADVLVYNVRPQAMARLGLSYDDVAAVNPRIIHVGCYGYGQAGPYAAKAAYDDLIQAGAGLPWLNSLGEGQAPHYAPINLADRLTGLHVVYAVTAALYQRERTGRGEAVEVPMLEAVTHFVMGDHSAGLTYDPPRGGPGYARLLARRPYATRDGWLCVLVYNDRQWQRFFEAIGEPWRMQEEQFSTQANRANHIRAVYDYLADLFATRTTVEWLALLEAADIPATAMRSLEEVVDDPHLNASGFFRWEEHPSEGRLRAMRTPTGWSRSTIDPPSPAPRLGEHTIAILREAGCSDEEIDRLLRERVVCASQ